MRRARWSFPVLAAWLVLCPLAAAGLFTALASCHEAASDESLDCCQPLAGAGRAPSAPAPLPVAVVAPSLLLAVTEVTLAVEGTAPPPGGDALQAVLSVYRI
jgi:hypothetical protein